MSDFHADTIAAVQQSLATTVKNTETARTTRDKHAEEARETAREFEASLVREADLRKLLRFIDPQHAEQYADPAGQQETGRREEIIAGLREMVDFLETFPELPVDRIATSFNLYPHKGDSEEDEREVDRIAAIIGVPAGRPTPATHYRATKKFGKHVSLEVLSCGRTDLTWNSGDPYPDWWPSEQSAREAGSEQIRPSSDEPYDGCTSVDNSTGQPVYCVHFAAHADPAIAGAGQYFRRHYNPAVGEWDDPADGGQVLDEQMVSMGALGEVDT